MDALQLYDSGQSSPVQHVDLAPPLSSALLLTNDSPSSQQHIMANSIVNTKNGLEMTTNLSLKEITKEVKGPENPLRMKKLNNKNFITGNIDREYYDRDVFNTEHYKYFNQIEEAEAEGVKTSEQIETELKEQKRIEKVTKKQKKQNRIQKGNAEIIEGENKYLGPWAGYKGGLKEIPINHIEEQDLSYYFKPQVDLRNKEDQVLGNETTIFHGNEPKDYLGRSYMHVPQDLDVDLYKTSADINCFLPKKTIHTWKGHEKGVSRIKLFPTHGHLLLSGSVDTTIKIWDVYHERMLLRTYKGHSKAIKDISFNYDGTKFVSSSYDKYIKLWDTETGKCLNSFTTGKTANCVLFHPEAEHQNSFLAGFTDKKILQYDIVSGEMVQRYVQHLGAVNSMMFVEKNKRFVSTADDKSLRSWEFDIPIVVKYIAEPFMYSMPTIALHPAQKWLACQSLDNSIYVYMARDRYKPNTKKKFSGHMVSGYACQVQFSNDGRFVISGDAEGGLFVWDWKTCKVLKKFKAHDNVVIDCLWHPQEASKVITCSYDGLIKLWD